MDGWILREQTTHYTYMPPIMKALVCDLIRSMNWRLSYIECLGTHYNSFLFNDNPLDKWIDGDSLMNCIDRCPDVQWVWGLLQGFNKSVSRKIVFQTELVDIQQDTSIWTNPVSMRNSLSEIEIEAFDSTMSIVTVKDEVLLNQLQLAFPNGILLSHYNDNKD